MACSWCISEEFCIASANVALSPFFKDIYTIWALLRDFPRFLEGSSLSSWNSVSWTDLSFRQHFLSSQFPVCHSRTGEHKSTENNHCILGSVHSISVSDMRLFSIFASNGHRQAVKVLFCMAVPTTLYAFHCPSVESLKIGVPFLEVLLEENIWIMRFHTTAANRMSKLKESLKPLGPSFFVKGITLILIVSCIQTSLTI